MCAAVEDIIKVVGEDNVETEQDVTETYQKENWSYHTGVRPYAIVHPESTEEVQKILKLCNQARIPVIPYGGGTALEGHTVSRFKSIVIDFRERMHSVLELNKDDMDVRVQPGKYCLTGLCSIIGGCFHFSLFLLCQELPGRNLTRNWSNMDNSLQ